MGLRIRQAPTRKLRSLMVGIAALALVAQPMANIIQIATAYALSPTITVVRPDAMNGWSGVDDNNNGGALDFSASPAGAPLGQGSAQLRVSNSSQGYLLFKRAYGDLKLSELTTLSYKTNVTTGNDLIAPSLQINIDRDTTDADTSWQGRLVYEPYMNAPVQDGHWQSWNAASGKWWLTKASKFDGFCDQGHPCTLAQLEHNFANIGVNAGDPGVGFKAGSSWNSFTGSIDDFAINQDRYDFEPSQGPSLVSPVNNSVVNGASVVNQWLPVDGAVKYIYESYKNAAATQLRWHEETTATQKSATNVANGTTFWWRVKSVAANGVVSGWSDLWKVTIDSIAPTVPTGGQPNGSTQPTNDFYFTWNGSSDASDVTYEFQSSGANAVDGQGSLMGAWNSILNGNSEQNHLALPKIHSTGAGDGTYHWQVRAIDAAGNKSAWSQVWDMRIDSQGPALSVTSPNEGQVFGGPNPSVSVEASASDPSSLGAYYVALDGNGKKYVFHPSNGTMATTSIDLSSLSEGVHTILVRVTDMLGHGTEVKRHITIDRTAPTTALNSPLAGQTVGGSTLELKGTVTDPNGVSEYHYQLLDGNKDNTLGNSVIGGHGEVLNDTLGSLDITNLPSGDYYVRLWAKDSLGNTSSPVYVKFTVDHTAPVVTLQTANTNPMASTSVTFSGKVVGGSDIASLKLYQNGVELADITSTIDANGEWHYTFPAGFTQGDYTFKVEVTDVYGNTSDELVSPQSVVAMSFSEYIPGRGAGISPDVTRQLTQALVVPSTVSAALPTPAEQDRDPDVLGTETEKDGAVKGAADKLAIAPTENGWKLFGLVWYWWLLILAALSAIVWRLVAWVRREDDVLPA